MKTKSKNNRQIRKVLKLALIGKFDTQANAAYQLKIDEGILSKIVNCVKDPTKDQTESMTKVLDMPPDKLFVKEDRV